MTYEAHSGIPLYPWLVAKDFIAEQIPVNEGNFNTKSLSMGVRPPDLADLLYDLVSDL